jgi:hypothetical protein
LEKTRCDFPEIANCQLGLTTEEMTTSMEPSTESSTLVTDTTSTDAPTTDSTTLIVTQTQEVTETTEKETPETAPTLTELATAPTIKIK